jgi:hypothetical protein
VAASSATNVALVETVDAAELFLYPGDQHLFTVFGDDPDGQCGIFVLWDTEANAEAAARVIRPQLDQHLAGHVQGPPETRRFEVLSA